MSEDVEVKQANFEGWCIVELMGHRKEIGYVTTQAFGPAVLFRCDTPGLDEREFTLSYREWATPSEGGVSQWCPAGTKVKRAATPARSCLIASQALYAINPCSEEAARTAIERNISRPLIILELPPQAALPAASDEDDIFAGDDDDGDDEDEEEF